MQKKQPDIGIFYSLAFINTMRDLAARSPDWGCFIDPCQTYTEDQLEPCGNRNSVQIDFIPYQHANPLFDYIALKMDNDKSPDYRCTAKYYAEFFAILQSFGGKLNRIIEVGPQRGDLSCFMAGSLYQNDMTLDLVDINKSNLIYAYEKIKRLFPDVIPKVRLFFGDLPIYIKNVVNNSLETNLIHYEGSYNFNDVIRDLGATFYCKNKFVGVMVHNVFQRIVDMHQYAFLDVALYALFGLNIQFSKLGEESAEETKLDQSYEPARYLSQNRIEGMYIPYSNNHFRYPYPTMLLEDFLYKIEETAVN